jgi:hypothetical protein
MVDAVSEAVALLRGRRQELAAQLENIDKALAALEGSPGPGFVHTVEGHVRPTGSKSLRSQILSAMPDRDDCSAEEIIESVDGVPNSVRSVLSRMVKAGELRSPSRGRYQRTQRSDMFSQAYQDTEPVTASQDASHELEPR